MYFSFRKHYKTIFNQYFAKKKIQPNIYQHLFHHKSSTFYSDFILITSLKDFPIILSCPSYASSNCVAFYLICLIVNLVYEQNQFNIKTHTETKQHKFVVFF